MTCHIADRRSDHDRNAHERLHQPDPQPPPAKLERYNAGIKARKAKTSNIRAPLERKAQALATKVARLIDAIEDGAGEFAEFKDRLRTARAELADTWNQIAAMDEEAPLELSSGAVDRYRTYVAELDAALGASGVSGARAATAIRGLIDTITVSASPEKRGVVIEVTGHLANLINLAKLSGN